MRRLIVAAALLALSVPLGGQAAPLVAKVYVFTATSEPPAADQAERQAIVDALKKSLPDNKRMALQVAVVDTREAATIAVEVTGANRMERAIPMTRGEVMVSPWYGAKAKLTYGTYATEFAAHAAQSSYRRPATSAPDSDRMAGPITTLMRLDAMTSLVTKIRDWITTNEADLRKK